MLKNKVVRNLPADDKYWIEEVGFNDLATLKPIWAARKQDFFTFHVILEGRGVLNIASNTYSLKAGDVFYCPKDTLFSYYPDEKNPWKYVWFLFRKKTAVMELERLGFSSVSPNRTLTNFDKVKGEIVDFISNLERNNKALLKSQSVFLGLLSEFDSKEIDFEPDGNYYVERARTYIENNCFDCNFRVSHVSEYLHLSNEYFCRLFKKETNINIAEYVKRVRMERAVEYLTRTNYTVKQTALLTGYNDYSHFCREFRKFFGLTAGEYKEKNICKTKF